MKIDERDQQLIINNGTLPPQQEFFLLWALLWELRKSMSWPSCYSYAFHSGTSTRTFHQLCCSLNARLRKESSAEEFAVRIASPGRRGFYQLAISPTIGITGNIVESAEHAARGAQTIKSQEYESAFKHTVAGLETCALTIANFQTADRLLGRFADRLDQSSLDELQTTIDLTATQALRWLSRIKSAFDLERFPTEDQEEVSLYLSEIDRQKDLIQRLVDRIPIDQKHSNDSCNPLNLVIDYWRNLADSELGRMETPEQILSRPVFVDYFEIVERTIELLPPLYLSTAPTAVAAEVTEDQTATTPPSLLLSLYELSAKQPQFIFPEPKTHENWKHVSAVKWAKATLGQLN